MVRTHIITRAAAENLLRERFWLHCPECGHRFEYYAKLFEPKPAVKCPNCQAALPEAGTGIMD